MITGTDGRRDSLKLALGAGCGLHDGDEDTVTDEK
jgi:hypothetical protein